MFVLKPPGGKGLTREFIVIHLRKLSLQVGRKGVKPPELKKASD